MRHISAESPKWETLRGREIFGALISKSLTEQFVGGARVTILPYKGTHAMYIIDDMKDRSSLYLHMPVENYERVPEPIPVGLGNGSESTTYQRYIFFK